MVVPPTILSLIAVEAIPNWVFKALNEALSSCDIVVASSTRKRFLNKPFQNNFTKGEIMHQLMDYEKIFKYFKWKPQVEFKEGINDSIISYKRYFKI